MKYSEFNMTPLEEKLKYCASLRNDIKGKILTSDEMTSYISWMNKTFGNSVNLKSLTKNNLEMMLGGEIAKLRAELILAPNDTNMYKQLFAFYELSKEHNVFDENQDITVSRSLRYMPSYWRANNYFEVFYSLSDDCTISFENEIIKLTQGKLILVPPGVIRADACLKDDSTLIYFTIRSSTFENVFFSHLQSHNIMSLFFKQALNSKNNTNFLAFDSNGDVEIEQLVYFIYKEYYSALTYSSQIVNSLMNVFFLKLLQRYEDSAQISKTNNLHWQPEFITIFQYIQNNFPTVTLKEVAQKFHYSERQIIRIIKNCTEKNFSQLITKIKMEHAARMIVAAPQQIASIANKVGYATLSSFYRAFSNYYKCTPASFVKQ